MKFNIDNECSCGISICFLDIVEIGLKSVLDNITTIIAASLTNKELFGNYEAKYAFVMGNPFHLSQGSRIHKTYTTMLKKAIDNSIMLKEKDTEAFVLSESIWQLLETTLTKPYMYDRFVEGALCQVSGETFAVRFPTSDPKTFYSFSRINRNGNFKSTIPNDGSYLVFLQRGEPISKKGLVVKIKAENDSLANTGTFINCRYKYVDDLPNWKLKCNFRNY